MKEVDKKLKKSKVEIKVERIIAQFNKRKKNKKHKDDANDKNIFKDKKQSNITNVFYIINVFLKFLLSFQSKVFISRFEKVSTFCSIFRNSLKSKAHVSKIKVKNDNLYKTFSIIVERNFAINKYSLHSFRILNHDINIHIVNDIMQYRFVQKRDCIDKFIIAIKRTILITISYDLIIINI